MKFEIGSLVVYPSHGVGKLTAIENQIFDGFIVELLVIHFEHDRMVLKLPKIKASSIGLRNLSSRSTMEEAFNILKIKIKNRRLMWSRRAQEYEMKINSGNPFFIAEVIRDLYKNSDKSEQSYSERQIYQVAVERFIRELAAVEQIKEEEALSKLEKFLKLN